MKSNIATRNPSDGERLQVIADSNVRWSSGSRWPGLVAEEYGFRQIETLEFEASDHHVVVHLSSAWIEMGIDGRRDTRAYRPGDIVLIPAGAARKVRATQAHKVLVMSLSPQMAADAAFRSGNQKLVGFRAEHGIRDAQVERLARVLMEEAELDYPSGPLFGEGVALALAAHLSEKYCEGRESAPLYKGGMGPQRLRRVLEYIQDNLGDALRMGTLAGIAGLSQFRFAHNFREAMGVAPHQYVIRARMERARQMLRETKLPILEIASAVGCQSASRFTMLFTRETGTTPSRYRALSR